MVCLMVIGRKGGQGLQRGSCQDIRKEELMTGTEKFMSNKAKTRSSDLPLSLFVSSFGYKGSVLHMNVTLKSCRRDAKHSNVM